MNGGSLASPEPRITVTFSGWPQSLKDHIQDQARRRSVREKRVVSASEIALEWVLLGKQHAPPEPPIAPPPQTPLPPMPEVGP